jgi:hypothetical protein
MMLRTEINRHLDRYNFIINECKAGIKDIEEVDKKKVRLKRA